VLHAIDNIHAGISDHFRVELAQQLRLFLQITIDLENQISSGMGKTGHDSLMMAEVPRKINHLDPVVSFKQGQGNIKRVVRRTIVDEYDLIVIRDPLSRSANAGVELLQVGRRIVQRRDD
jgi:hypothetical protein